jgi:hypothetical protein
LSNEGLPLEPFTAHDLHRAGSTLLNELDMCVRRSDTYGEEMGQSDLSRRIAHGDSGCPVLTILNPFLLPRRLPQPMWVSDLPKVDF